MSLRHAFALQAVLLAGFVSAEDTPKPLDKPADAAAEARKKQEEMVKKMNAPKIFPGSMLSVDEFKEKTGATDEDVKKIQAALDAVKKKDDELQQKPEVTEAKKKLEEAQKAYLEANRKLQEVRGNYNVYLENQKAVVENMPAEKRDMLSKLIHYYPPPVQKPQPVVAQPVETKKPDTKPEEGEKKAEPAKKEDPK